MGYICVLPSYVTIRWLICVIFVLLGICYHAWLTRIIVFVRQSAHARFRSQLVSCRPNETLRCTVLASAPTGRYLYLVCLWNQQYSAVLSKYIWFIFWPNVFFRPTTQDSTNCSNHTTMGNNKGQDTNEGNDCVEDRNSSVPMNTSRLRNQQVANLWATVRRYLEERTTILTNTKLSVCCCNSFEKKEKK
jgi:hypothetical protein